jgi:hypothetical protein
MPARGARIAGCAIALLLLALSDAAVAAQALLPRSADDGCAVVMPCCTTGFCPLAAHRGKSRTSQPALQACDAHAPVRGAVSPLRPPAILVADLTLPRPGGAATPVEPAADHAPSRSRLPETPPPDATR